MNTPSTVTGNNLFSQDSIPDFHELVAKAKAGDPIAVGRLRDVEQALEVTILFRRTQEDATGHTKDGKKLINLATPTAAEIYEAKKKSGRLA